MNTPTKFEREYYNKLVGKMVTGTVWIDMSENGSGPVFPALKFSGGTLAVVYQDPEGNGPGWLEIIEPGKGEPHA